MNVSTANLITPIWKNSSVYYVSDANPIYNEINIQSFVSCVHSAMA